MIKSIVKDYKELLNDNTNLSDIDINYKLILDNFLIEYRDILDFSSTFKFGFELESEFCYFDQFKKIFNNSSFFNNEYVCEIDTSLYKGVEVKSPILHNNIDTWKELKDICLFMKNYSSIGQRAASHIHIDKSIIGNSSLYLYRFLKLWACFEPIIFRFGYGEYSGPRPFINNYAKPISLLIYEDIRNFDLKENKFDHSNYELLRVLLYERNQSLNFSNINRFNNENKKDTFEFRLANGTLNPTIWQNLLNLYIHMFLYVKSDKYDDELLSDKLKNISTSSQSFININKININDAVMFSDMIFDNNIDKLNFLKQYFKDFNDEFKYIKCKKFTK